MSYIKYFRLISDLVSGKISRKEFELQTVNQGLFLKNLVSSYLQRKTTFLDFEKLFTTFYFDITDGFLDETEKEFISEINEKLSWTSEFPTKYERSVGWIDQEEFIDWLNIQFQKYKISKEVKREEKE